MTDTTINTTENVASDVEDNTDQLSELSEYDQALEQLDLEDTNSETSDNQADQSNDEQSEQPEWIERIKQFRPDVDINNPQQVQQATWQLYRELEKQSTQSGQQLSELKKFREDTSGLVQLQEWINQDPQRASQVREFFSDLKQEELRMKFGEELPDKVLEQLQEAQITKQEVLELKRQLQERAEDEALANALSIAKKFAIDNKIEYSESKLLDYMSNNGISNPTAAIKALSYDQQILAAKKQTEIAMKNKIQEAKRNGILSNSGGNASASNSIISQAEEDDLMGADIDTFLAANI